MNHRSHLTLLTLIGTLLGATVAASAQSAPPNQSGPPQGPAATAPHAHHRGMMARAMDGLNITSDQRAQMKAAREKFKASRQTSTPESAAEYKADVEAAMTPTQRTQFESNVKSLRQQMRAERQAQMQQNAQPPPPAPKTS